MPWQCSFKKLCFFAPIMPKIMLAQSAKAYLKPPAEKAVLKIARYAQRLTQGYSVYGGSS